MRSFSVKIKSKLLTAIACIFLLLALAVGFVFLHFSEKGTVSVSDIGEMVSYINSFGYTVEPTQITDKNVVIPYEFDEIYIKYNDIQLAQGFDLSRYAGKEVRIVGFAVTDEKYGEALAELIVYREKIIGADISSFELGGFLEPLKKTAE